MDFGPLVSKKQDRFNELDAIVSEGDIFKNPAQARDILREHNRLKTLLQTWSTLQKKQSELTENRELVTGSDPELAELAAAEIPALEQQISTLEQEIQISLLPPDPNEDRDAIVEIRAGTGGDEAGLFAADLFRM